MARKTEIQRHGPRGSLWSGLALGLALLAAVPAGAQNARQSATMPPAFDGLGVDSGEPIQFEAESLEVRENDSLAVFSGNVVARQKQTVLKSDTLTVHYLGKAGEGAQKVERIVAAGKVLVSAGPQTASGDQAVFDTVAKTIVVSGNVVLTQGENVIRGPRLVINIESGQAKMDGGRVQMLIEPQSLQDDNTTN
ncbi:LptA/OstA family protein [Methylobrevis pamukkalensis]|uniref:LPS-assembly protein LptD n=1 Tax=Methylobrevis pamukkalensis TaxID=1439726 RepID=A0A1E3GZ96_9HYPH|nr:LptA/OstA family protein [Methylobrevis pamukkalensis]ODN69373.1 LPS-assembly protein LptD [Methylobrevis pamukkalensis]